MKLEDAYRRYISWETVWRLLRMKGMSTEQCQSCLDDFDHEAYQDASYQAGIDIFLGKGRWTRINCKCGDKLFILKQQKEQSVSR